MIKKPSANGLIDNPLRDIFKEQNNLNTDVMECKWASEVLDANYNISTRNPYSDLKDATISYGFIQLSATPDGPPISCMDIEKDGRGLQYSELDSTKSTAHNTFWGKQQPTTSSGATTPGNDKKEFGRIMPNNMSIAKHVHFRKELTTYPKNSFDRGVMFLAREHFDSFITSDVTIEGGLTFDTRVDKYLPSGTPVVYDSNGGTPIPELVEGQIYYTLRGSSGLTAGTGADRRDGGARARHIRLSATKNGPAIVIGNGRGAGYTKENEPTTSEYGNALAAPGDNTEKAIPDYYSVHGTDASIGQNKASKGFKETTTMGVQLRKIKPTTYTEVIRKQAGHTQVGSTIFVKQHPQNAKTYLPPNLAHDASNPTYANSNISKHIGENPIQYGDYFYPDILTKIHNTHTADNTNVNVTELTTGGGTQTVTHPIGEGINSTYNGNGSSGLQMGLMDLA